MPENPPQNGDTQAIFIQLVSDAIKSTSGLTAKMEIITELQKRQDSKLDGLLTSAAKIETLTSNLDQRMGTNERVINDHEVRIRIVEPKLLALDNVTKRVDALETDNEEHETEIVDLQKALIRYGTVAAFLFFTLQLAISIFVVPWAQRLLGN